MKKIYLFIAAAMIAVSCSDDDSKSNRDAGIDANLLIGRWDLVSLKENGNHITLNDCDYGTWKEFKTDKTFVEEYKCGSSTYTEESNYTVSGNTITNVVPGDPDSPYVFKVTELTPDILTYTYDYRDEDNIAKTNTFTYNKL